MASLVAIDLAGGPEFVAALRRAWEAGDAVAPLDQRLPPAARREVLAALAPSAIVDGDGRRPVDRGRPVEDGDALVVATSGTTGGPKGVVLTHAAVAASAIATSTRLGVEPGRHRWLACLPLSHVGGLSVVTRALVTGTPLEVLPRFDAVVVAAAATRSTFVSLVATALLRVDASDFHTVVLGGSAPPAGLPGNVVTTYGMTETGSGVVYDGVPLDGVEVAIGDGGEVRLRGPMLLRAYRDGTVPVDGQGWLATGDAGAIEGDGRLVIHGRLSDLIISGGEHIWPSPVEAVLRRHPGVAEVVVAGRPDREWGERVVAWVVPASPAAAAAPTLDELRSLVKKHLAPWAAPRELVVVESLPRTSIGKIRRADLPGG